MIQDRPRCFVCEEPIEYGAIYAPPMCDHEGCASACFHGVCLMEWRENRVEKMKQAREAITAFLRHVNGDCDCPQDRPEVA